MMDLWPTGNLISGSEKTKYIQVRRTSLIQECAYTKKNILTNELEIGVLFETL